MLTVVLDSPYCVHIKPQGPLVLGHHFDVDVWVNTLIVEQKSHKPNLEEAVIDFQIATPVVIPEYHLCIGAQHADYPMAIEKNTDFLCFKAMNIPVLPVLNPEKAIVNVSLLQNRQNFFYARMPFQGCITQKESLR